MTLAIEKVLPEPVTPSSTWCLSPSAMPRVMRLNGVALVALRFVRTYKSEFHDRLALPGGQLNSLGSLTEVNFGEWASLYYTTLRNAKGAWLKPVPLCHWHVP